MNYRVEMFGEERSVAVTDLKAEAEGWSRLRVRLEGGDWLDVRARRRGDALELEWGGKRRSAVLLGSRPDGGPGATVHELSMGPEVYRAIVRAGVGGAKAQAGGAAGGSVPILAPMPGRVVAINVAQGQSVKKGDLLLTLEAMKMQNEFVAPCDGKMAELRVKPSAVVGAGDVLAVIAPS